MSEEKKFWEIPMPEERESESTHIFGTRYGDDHGELYESEGGNLALYEDYETLLTGLQQIVDRSNSGELGTSKVIDMRNIAVALLAQHGGV